jgi:Protein of unknown function (DUF2726)
MRARAIGQQSRGVQLVNGQMMELTTGSWIWITALIIGAAAVLWRFKAASADKGMQFSLENFRPRTMRPLTRQELAVYAHLNTAVPECLVLPQVSLSRFLQVTQNRSYQTWFQKVGRRCVDFLVCSAKGDVLGVIELGSGKSRRAGAASEGAQRKAESLRMAGIAIWNLNPQDLPSLDELREMILTQWQASVQHSAQDDAEWKRTELAPRDAGLEVEELSDSRWQQQPWPTEEARASDFLDALEGLPQAR